MAYTAPTFVNGGAPPLNAANLNALTAEVQRLGGISAVTPQGYGATGNGTTDDGPALQACFTAAASSGASVYIPPGNYKTGQDLTLPHGTPLIGAGSAVSRIFSTVQRRLKITGDSGKWLHHIADLTLDLVGILAGATTSDFGRGLTLTRLEVCNSDVGVEYRNHCWNTRIDNCRIYGCIRGVYNNFTGVIDSGAAMTIHATTIFNNTGAGFEQASSAIDGWHVQITDSNIEHCASSIKLRAVGDGTLDVVNGHYELNAGSYIDADSGAIFITGGWMFGQQASSVAHFVLSGSARCYLNSGRVAWDSVQKLALVTGTAQLIVNPDELRWNRPWGLIDSGTDGQPFATGSVRGVTLPAGFTIAHKRDFGPILPGGANIVAQRLAAYDENTYEITFTVDVWDVGAANTVAIFWNPGGATVSVIPIPNSVGTTQVRIVLRYNKARIYWQHSSGVGGMVDTNIAHALSIDKFIELRNGGNATVAFYDWTCRVFANTA